MRSITLTSITGAGEDMFDGLVGTQTTGSGSIAKTFPIAGFNCVAILNTYGISATLVVDGESQEVSLIRDSIKDWWDYWFAPNRPGRDVVFYFPEQLSGNASITISYPGGTAKCGLCVTGLAREVAATKYGTKIGITDYSRVDTNEFGQTYLKEGRWAKRVDAKLGMLTDLDIAYRDIVYNVGTPCVFDYNDYNTDLTERHTSEDGIQSLIVYGFTEDIEYNPVSMPYWQPQHTVQGLT